MNQLKIVVFLFITIIAFSSCEKDDICLEEITPKLIIRFYDFEDTSELKKALNLKVQIEGIDGDYTDETITALTDSIAIPIKVTDDITKFKLTITQIADDETTSENEDTFDLVYTRVDEFVSRSCGYKTLFHNTEIPLENVGGSWIDSIKVIDREQNILNEKSAHVKIFH